MTLAGRRVAVGICGGIAAYKMPQIIRMLLKQDCEVQAILTANGERFAAKATLATLTRRPVITSLFDQTEPVSTRHIATADWAEALLVAPATANILAKFACGIADDFLSTLYLSLKTPVLCAPSMNTVMWEHPATQENLAILRKRGVVIVPPASGDLACGSSGAGRLAPGKEIVFAVRKALSPQDLAGKKMLITCGGTQEQIDPVRVISNKSTGKMGIALAIRAAERGAQVTLVHGALAQAAPQYLLAVPALSTADMAREVRTRFPKNDILVMAAAVADFTPKTVARKKIKKQAQGLTLNLVAAQDILKEASRKKGKRVIVGFALDSDDRAAQARKKLIEKKCDLLVANPPMAIGSETTALTLYAKDGSAIELGPMTKKDAAEAILDRIAAL
ncbi:MAG: hypothetical protein A2268_16715 [Candidatus Raymondbacteria bacterium RifOxyA12_full_50_37]|nr:MAG: hypothetical protein A2268_16715 [Candidatus Raymondbacteria bacterium RifOxyA12_full_50_37]OGJ86252.1 MAG: hypothetical protein A2248_16305 [Candidatus Raymondbacteria bacterium RIFOXYA2_FULL_49_16]OGJ95790.1 MAG: hypothetical protein A2453_11625 [Candidatus Raymondbacteria bacterium RIFOXYC2_FULL_50_21]OGK03935.1 MAG: hypothetical protein A2487_12090 [Candidatus Raymondbacteria bacterium RifOxyC12_full_50_8]OGP42704.1 MAG: hypothetical protein A2324_00720 [Candidatus Raymondbacteria b